MPNWCENELIITCNDPISFKKFIELSGIDKNNFKFNNIRPMPEQLRGISTGGITINEVAYTQWRTDKDGTNPTGIGNDEIDELYQKYGASNWYDWCCKYWGVKWDVQDVDYMGLDFDNREAHLYFSTAWSPPEEMYDYIRLHFPGIDMNWFYKESGMQIAGWLGT